MKNKFKAFDEQAESDKTYDDGKPHHDIQYFQSKIILKGERFTSAQSFLEFAKLVKKAAEKTDVKFDTSGFEGKRPNIREILFLDTKDNRLYNNSFILRRRCAYQDGFLSGDPEIVFKFRHPDMATAAAKDVRPNLLGNHKVKFKSEILPLKDKLGGKRTLYSHNVQFPLSAVPQGHLDLNIVGTDRYVPYAVKEETSLANLIYVLPALKELHLSDQDMQIGFVNHVAVEEVLLDIGKLDFGKGVTPTCNVSVWRTRGDQRQLVGEFAFQCKYDREGELNKKQMDRADAFFTELQFTASDWIALGTTKTGALYRLKGTTPSSHE